MSAGPASAAGLDTLSAIERLADITQHNVVARPDYDVESQLRVMRNHELPGAPTGH